MLGLSSTLLRSTQERISLQVSAYLEPAAHATLLAHTMLGRGGATQHDKEAYAFAASVLTETPQIANVLFADGAGNFMLVTRAANGQPGATDTKRILVSASGRTVEWVTRDKSGAVTARREDPKDDYDARTRSWFTGARASADVFWSGVYIFFSERAPGVTAAVHGPGPDPDVIGVDIRLDAISRFLGGLSIGQTGRAYIATRDGEMIAGPDSKRILQTVDGKLAPARIGQVGDPDLTASWDHFRAQGPGNRVIDVNQRRLISIVTPLANNGQDWLLFITVPESEFSGFVTANTRRAALLSLVVVALAAGLGVLLVRQGLRADRSARVVAERSAAVEQQSAAFARLSAEAGMFDPDGTPPKALTETLAEATGAKRAAVWRCSGQGQALRCDDSFEPATGGHVGGLELSRQEMPALFDAMAEDETIDAPDARRDRRTAALHGSLMAPFGSNALLAVPVTRAGRAIGLVTLEDARRDPAARDFARACATLVALATPDRIPEAGTAPQTSAAAEAEPVADERGLDPALAAYSAADETHPQAMVLVLTLPDATAPLAHQVACSAQSIAAAHEIPYVKMLGTTIVAAAGFATQSPAGLAEAASRMADVAIALRERCAELFDSDGGLAAFGLGLDVGSVVGATLGYTPGVFNLWGETVQAAGALAASAPAESIQASEPAYLLLRQGFLFRPRGLFYRPHTGDSRSFVLAGRA
ncbi:GAF domain-containing protein [Rhodopila sp.]|uniref:GAF domain-containing protein n=1 Tax=Rhodopila sp. TaxID=2480087 RepID=UPI003D1418B7